MVTQPWLYLLVVLFHYHVLHLSQNIFGTLIQPLFSIVILGLEMSAGFLKLRRDIHARAFVGLSAGRARKLKS